MRGRLADLRDALASSYEDVRAQLVALSELDLDAPAGGGRSVRDIAEHVIDDWDRRIETARRLVDGRRAGPPALLARIRDLRGALRLRKPPPGARSDILQALEDAFNDLFAFVNTLSDEELDCAGDVRGIGRVSAYELLAMTPAHVREHCDEIAAALAGAPARPDR